MTQLFRAETRIEAWLKATDCLIKEGEQLNLILEIESPEREGKAGQLGKQLLSDIYVQEDQLPVHTVAETIFPGWEYRRRGLKGVFETYAKEYEAFKGSRKGGWGTYAHRLIARPTPDGGVVNPLQRLIEKMSQAHNVGPGYRACYELGVADGAYEMPLYNNAVDGNRYRGGPCLSHLSFKLLDGHVHLTALYRAHDYRFKVPGNLLGLARLQSCVAQEVGAELGTLVVHSTRGFIPTSPSTARFKDALEVIRNVIAEE